MGHINKVEDEKLLLDNYSSGSFNVSLTSREEVTGRVGKGVCVSGQGFVE